MNTKPILFVKAIPPGARWITIHPHGKDEKGQPVLIQENQDGSAHIIGGAGGKLNYLKLRGVKSKDEYARSAVERQKARAEERKKQRQLDKQTGVYEAKQAARKDVALQRGAQEAEFVRTVASTMGWKPEELSFPEEKYEHLSDAAVDKLRGKHQRELLKRANEAVELQRQVLLNDADARAAAGLGEVPLETKDTDTISVADLDPIRPETAGLGFSADYKERAEEAGLTEPELQKEVQQIREQKQAQMTDSQRRAAIQRGETAKLVKQELKDIRETDLPKTDAKVVEAQKAVELLKAQKKLREVQKKATEANKAIDKATEPKAFVLEVGNSDPDVTEDLENDLRTMRTRAFLSEVGKRGELGKHVGVGAFNSINAVALAAGGDALVDRSVVDVLGVAGAAQVLARRLQADLSPEEFGRVSEGMEEFHLHHYMETSERALKQAGELQDAAKAIELGEAETTHDLTGAQELNAKRRDAVRQANEILGTALGEMEANAALVAAMRQGRQDSLQVAMGSASADAIIKQARAIGLQRGDYKIETLGSNTFLTVTGAGMDRLAKPVNREDMLQVRRNLDIIEGKHDEDNWLPLGIATRPDLDMPVPAGVAPSLAEPFQPPSEGGSEAMAGAIKDYIGGRMADGDTPGDIYADLLSMDIMEKVGDRRDEYMKALDHIAPARDEKGKMIRAEDRADYFNALADAFVQKRYGGERSALNSQKFTVDQNAVDALHRALSDHPEGVAAFKAIGDLTPQDQRALREVFYRDVAKESPEAAEMRAQLDQLNENEPEREAIDMFGEASTNPEWSQWRQQRDELAGKVAASGLNWSRYLDMMRGNENAYAAIQDLIRSNVSRRFAEHHNTLNPGAPLKVGRTTIRNNLNHLDAVDPAAREARLAKERELVDSLRERVQGRYAAGAVSDKLDDAREQREAFEQAQMGFFASDGQDDMFGGADAPKQDKPLATDERHTIGHEAERQVAAMMGVVGRGFKPGQPLKLWNPTMSGGKNAARQRAIKLLEANKRVGLHFGVGTGKAQPLDAKVLTPTGWVRMGDLTVGDRVISVDGSATTVTGVYPQGVKPIYRVRFSDGAETECCDDHLWLTQTEVERKREAYGAGKRDYSKVRSLSEVRDTLRVRGGIKNHSIPICKPVQFDPRHVPVAPYLLGLLLGDGCLAIENAASFSTADPILAKYLQDQMIDGVVVQKHGDLRYDYRISSGVKGGNDRQKNALIVALSELGLMGKKSAEKFIPDQYKFNSFDVRLGVLQGLMDTDGTVDRRTGSVTFCTVSELLRDDVVFLARSIGGLATISSRVPSYTYNGEKRVGQRAYNITLQLPAGTNPFRLPRKRDKVIPRTKYEPKRRFIESIEFVGEKEAQCISVDHPTRLYVTDHLIVTHNTLIGLGGFTHLHGKGAVKRGIFAVPSIVQGQFGGEALRYLEPGKFSWHCEPGASREERLKAYKDPAHHFCVVTHQSLRDDMLHLGAQHAGVTNEEMRDRVAAMSPEDRKAWGRATMEREGINFDYMMVDEGHNLLDRQGKEDSGMSHVLGAISANTPYYVSATGDPVKNDLTEAFSALQKLAPERYTDRAAFMRKYGVNTAASKDLLRREMARYFYPSKIDPDVTATKSTVKVSMTDGQRQAMSELDKHVAKARLARMQGKVDVDAMRAISPESFEGTPEAEHEKLAGELQRSLGIMRETARHRIINAHPDSGKLSKVAELVAERKGKPGVVFAHSLAAVEQIRRRLEADGHKVITITGGDSSKDKERKRAAFQDHGEADILVASDAASTGMNIQRGQFLVQYDTPMTAKDHAQRNGRIHRTGQRNNVELLDLVSDHPSEEAARKRLANKYMLRQLMTDPLDGLDDTGLAGFLRQRDIAAQEGQGGLF